MKELEYPFDAAYLLAHKRQVKKALLASRASFLDKKIAVLGGSTTAGIVQMLELFLLKEGIRPSFYESGYGQYYEDAVFSNEKLRQFQPDMVYIHTTNRNVTRYPLLSDDASAIDAMLDHEFERFQSMWDSLAKTYGCPVIQNNFEMPYYRLLGNKDASDIHGAVNYLTRLNLKFYEYAQTHTDFFICDINYLSADYGLREWSDPFYWHMYKYAMHVNATPYLAFGVSKIIKSVYGKNKKGFVLDLDQTLWGGVVGEDGAENIRIGPEDAEGAAYLEFQDYVKAHKQLGAVLTIASKNEEANARAGLNHPDGGLRPDDFAVIKANWEQKDRSVAAIAAELHVLPESLVFIDDNPAERHLVATQLAGVPTPAIGAVHQYIATIDRNGYFEATYLSQDDLRRVEMYRDNARREALQASFADYGEYLDSLDMRAQVRPFEPMYMARIAQLTNKSNQFNLTTRRYTQAQIGQISKDGRYITLYGRLEDCFGDNGVVSVVIGRLEGAACHIQLWLMSCRVLKRGMEYAMMDALVHSCQKRGVTELVGYYIPTEKNGMVKDFYEQLGYRFLSGQDGGTVWKFEITNEYIDKHTHMQVKEQDL